MKRNITLDYFKLFLSVLVITIHIAPLFSGRLNTLGWLISNGIARMAVPCFFIINGYFIGKKINNRTFVKKYLLRLIIIYAVWTLIYSALIHISIKPEEMIFVLLSGYFHLWYLGALIVAVLMLALFNYMRGSLRQIYTLLIISILLFITGYFLQDYFRSSSWSHSIRLVFYRNGLFVGFPFVFLGYFIKEKEARLQRLKNHHLLYVATFSLLVLLVESFLAKKESEALIYS
jgi:surface polysaccharide O-acyltransferase-like enzyme